MSFVGFLGVVGWMRQMVAGDKRYWAMFHEVGKVGMVISPGTGIVGYSVSEVQRKLRKKNKELEQAVAQGAVVIEEQEKELRRALEIHRGLLPKELPQLKGMELAMNRRVMEEVAGFCHRHFRDDVTVVALAIR